MSKVLQYPILPDDLISEILLHLPVKSIGRFKCVAKSWRSLLSGSWFVKRHLDFHIHDPDQIMFSDVFFRRHDLLALSPESWIVGAHFEPTRLPLVVGSCQGLVLFLQDLGNFRGLLVNPVTLDAIRVPKIGLPSELDHIRDCMYGLGYDSCKNDFKIVSISRYGRVGPRNIVSTYSLKTETWRLLGNSSPYEHRKTAHGVFVSGCLHWVSQTKGDYVIAAFDLATEEFENVAYPSSFDCAFGLCITVLSGYLVMATGSSSNVDVWTMKEYGVQDSWTKFTVRVPYKDVPGPRLFPPRCFLNEDEVVLVEDYKKFVVYDRRNRMRRHMVLDDTPNWIT